MLLYALTILLGSFLLFQIQPMFAKLILLWFGGSAGVWTTCMLFFQTTLLLGYLYAHWSVTRLSARKHLAIHFALLAVCILLLPVSPPATWRPAPTDDPAAGILRLLLLNIGLPYFILSATSPLIQAWYARRFQGAAPYRLFALSNLGSAIALLTYPVLVEPFLTTRVQTRLWSGLFAIFAVSCGATAWRSCRTARIVPEKPGGIPNATAERPTRRGALMWFLLAACASLLLLSVTNFLTQDIAPAPFLWVLPLLLYLLTFILCFDADGWYRRKIFLLLLPLLLAPMAYLLWPWNVRPGLPLMLGVFGSGFFVCCMVCHGELARLRPPPRYLTAYFVTIAAGGAAGGLFVGVVAPRLFKSAVELQSGLVMCLTLAVMRIFQDPPLGLAARPRLMRVLVALPAGLAILLVLALRHETRDSLFVARNFYGTLRVVDRMAEGDKYRVFIHGAINHGEQWLEDDLQHDPVTYFCSGSGIGQALTRTPGGRPWRVGVIGLGAGTLAAYGRPGDSYRFYEINPLVVDVAKNWFTYLRESRATIEVVPGDGRLSLEREPSQNFDLLAIDAFASDSIPVHLLTREAFRQYFRHLRPDGTLAIQATNRYVDLRPLLESMAASFGTSANSVEDDGDGYGICFSTRWVLMAAGGSRLALRNGRVLDAAAHVRPWTDDYSNVFRLLRWFGQKR